MPETPRTVSCPNCGAAVTGAFCPLCGEAMPGPVRAASRAPRAPDAAAAPAAPVAVHRSHGRMWTGISLVAFAALAMWFAGRSMTAGPMAPPDAGGAGGGPMG
ncbi:MAG TPA: hypothetical protein VF737_16190, partial [Gemmatimonadaceae bacterium]